MAKGKPTSKIAKGAKGRKNHGPKRFLHHDFYPKATRMNLASCGVFNKYSNYESFCLAMQSRGIRTDHPILWNRFQSIKMVAKDGDWVYNRAAQDEFFRNAKQIAAEIHAEEKKKSKKGAKA